MSNVKVSRVKNNSLPDTLNAYLSIFNDNDELVGIHNDRLMGNWNTLLKSNLNPAQFGDSKNLRARYLTFLSSEKVDASKAASVLSILRSLDELKLNDARFNTLMANLAHLYLDTTDSLIACLGIMHRNNIPITADDNLQWVMRNAPLFQSLLEAFDPVTKQRFDAIKRLSSTDNIAEKSAYLPALVTALQKHKLTVSDNLPLLASLPVEQLNAVSSVLNQTEAEAVNQHLVHLLRENAPRLVTRDPDHGFVVDGDKVTAFAQSLSLISKANINLDSQSLRRLMEKNHMDIAGRNRLFEALVDDNKRFFSGTSLSLDAFDTVCNTTVDLAAPNILGAIEDSIKLIRKSMDVSNAMLNELLRKQPENTRALLTYLAIEQKTLSKERIATVLANAEHLDSSDKMTNLQACITHLTQNNIPLTKNNHLGTLMQLNSDQLCRANRYLSAMNKVTPERLAIVLNTVAAVDVDNDVQMPTSEALKKCIGILENHKVPLSKHGSLAALMRMNADELEEFNKILKTLDNVYADDKVYQALARKLDHLQANSGKMPALNDLIDKMIGEKIPLVGGFFDKLLGRKDSISQLAKLGSSSLDSLKSNRTTERLKEAIQDMKGEKYRMISPGTERLAGSRHPDQQVHADSDLSDGEDQPLEAGDILGTPVSTGHAGASASSSTSSTGNMFLSMGPPAGSPSFDSNSDEDDAPLPRAPAMQQEPKTTKDPQADSTARKTTKDPQTDPAAPYHRNFITYNR